MSGPQYYLYFHPPENSGVDAAWPRQVRRRNCGNVDSGQHSSQHRNCYDVTILGLLNSPL